MPPHLPSLLLRSLNLPVASISARTFNSVAARQFHSSISTSDTISASSTRPTPNQTVSPEEIEHFNRLGSTWWDEAGSFGLLHRMNPIRTQFIRERMLWDVTPHSSPPDYSIHGHQFLTGRTVLDVGCGGGIFSEVLARLGGDVLGIDAASGSIQAAQAHACLDPALNYTEPGHEQQPKKYPDSPSRLSYRHRSVEDLLEEDGQRERYDLVCAMEVVEHVEDLHAFLSGLAQLTKPGGHIVLSTISRTPLSRFLAITLAESGLPIIGIVPPGTHTYEKFIKPEQIANYFRGELGWARSFERSELESRGSFYEPFSGRWALFPREAKWGQLCNYFLGVKKPLC